jgi:hypothetical protein
MTVTTDTEAIVRRAYHLAEGDVLDAQGFMDLFAEDGVLNGIGGVSGQESYRGEQLGRCGRLDGQAASRRSPGAAPDRRPLVCARRQLTTPGERPVATDLRF